MAQRELTGNEIGAIKRSLETSFKTGIGRNNYYYYCAFLEDFADGMYANESKRYSQDKYVSYAKNAVSNWENVIYPNFSRTLPFSKNREKKRTFSIYIKNILSALENIILKEMNNELQYAKSIISRIEQEKDREGEDFSGILDEMEKKYTQLKNTFEQKRSLKDLENYDIKAYTEIIRYFNMIHYGTEDVKAILESEIKRIEDMQEHLQNFENNLRESQNAPKDSEKIDEYIQKELSKIYNIAIESNGAALKYVPNFMKDFKSPAAPSYAIAEQIKAVADKLFSNEEFVGEYIKKISEVYKLGEKNNAYLETIEQEMTNGFSIAVAKALTQGGRLQDIFNNYNNNTVSNAILEDIKAYLLNTEYGFTIKNEMDLSIKINTEEDEDNGYYETIAKILKKERKKNIDMNKSLSKKILDTIKSKTVNIQYIQEIETDEELLKILQKLNNSKNKTKITAKLTSNPEINITVNQTENGIQFNWNCGTIQGNSIKSLLEYKNKITVSINDENSTAIYDYNNINEEIKFLNRSIASRKGSVTKALNPYKDCIDNYLNKNIKKMKDSELAEYIASNITIKLDAPALDEGEAVGYVIRAIDGHFQHRSGKSNNKNDVIKITYGVSAKEIASQLIDKFSLDKTKIQELAKRLKKVQLEYLNNFENQFTAQYQDAFSHGKKNNFKGMTQNVIKNMKNKVKKQDDMIKTIISEMQELFKLESQQIERLEKDKNSIDSLREFVNKLTQTLYLSETMKTSNMNIESIGFGGGSLGGNVLQQLEKINEFLTRVNAGIPEEDLKWIAKAIINMSDDSLYGEKGKMHQEKNKLESFLGSVVALAMFDEGDLEIAKILNQIDNYRITTPDFLHMYKLNGVYYPGSYVLYLTWKELKFNLSKVQEGIEKSAGARADIVNKMNSERFLTIVDKTKNNEGKIVKTSRTVTETDSNLFPYSQETAFEEVHIQAAFLAGVLATLHQVQNGFKEIHMPA